MVLHACRMLHFNVLSQISCSDTALWINSLTRVLSHVTTNNISHTVSMLEGQGGVHILAHLTTNHLKILDC